MIGSPGTHSYHMQSLRQCVVELNFNKGGSIQDSLPNFRPLLLNFSKNRLRKREDKRLYSQARSMVPNKILGIRDLTFLKAVIRA